MRMFAWTNLLGRRTATRRARCTRCRSTRCSRQLGLLDGSDWLGGQHIAVILALVYGYVPYLILPLFAALDRIDQRLIEAARDLGASPARRLLARRRAALEDRHAGRHRAHRAADVRRLLHARPDVGLAEDGDARQRDQRLRAGRPGQVARRGADAAALGLPARLHALLPARRARRPARGGGADERGDLGPRPRRAERRPLRDRLSNPWGRPRFLAIIDLGLHRCGRCCRCCWRSASRSTRAARARRCRAGRCAGSGRTRRSASATTRRCWRRSSTASMLAALVDAHRHAARAPRWRSACGAGAGPAPAWPTSLMLLPLVTPELVFAVGMFLLFTTAFGVHRAGHDRRRRSGR